MADPRLEVVRLGAHDVVTSTMWYWIRGQERVGSQGRQICGWKVDGVGVGGHATPNFSGEAKHRKRVFSAVKFRVPGRKSQVPSWHPRMSPL